MRAPALSEPKSNLSPTYQVPQESAMRGSAPPVQVQARATWGGRADPPSPPTHSNSLITSDVVVAAPSVINGSSCSLEHLLAKPATAPETNSNTNMQSVTENCLLIFVTVPKIQRIDHAPMVAHNNSSKVVDSRKFGALTPLHGRDNIPYQKADDEAGLHTLEYNRFDNEMRSENTQYFETPLRLRGGGESSLSTGTSGWGTPPSQQATNNNANKTNTTLSNGQQPPATSQQPNNTGWGQPGVKPPVGGGPPSVVPNNMPQPPNATGVVAPTPNPQNNNNGQLSTTNTSTKQQLEQLNNMREAIFSQDGWGGQHVNQDTNWDIPGSPEPAIKPDGANAGSAGGAPGTAGNVGGGGGPAPWKPNVNNGTELWEANLRNGGQPPPQPQQKTPWGHTPSTNIGGTWGEDDETDSSNVWTGVPSGQQQWNQGGGAGGNAANGPAMWGGPKKENDWGGERLPGVNAGGGWGNGPDPRAAGIDPRDMRPDLRDMRAANNESIRMLDPREQMRLASGDMRGDPRGITGRLNGAGAAEAYWGPTGPHTGSQHMHHQNKMPPIVPGGGNTAGWEEPSPPSQRRNMPNYDDGTSLWGPGSMGGRGGNAGNNGQIPPGMPPSARVGGGVNKPDPNGGWSGPGNGGGGGRNGGSWDEGGNPGWDDQGPWPKKMWNDEPDWNHKMGGGAPKQQFSKEMVWNSKQFRCLVDMGFKKEEVEAALRARDMNYEDALEILSPLRNQEGWRNRHDDHYGDHPQFPGQRFSGPSGQMFPPGNNGPNMLNSMNSSTGGANNSLINNISPAVVQKMLTQGCGGTPGFGGGAMAGGGRNVQPQSQPSTQQLRMLVQQIQMAVQAGYLNHQILNQPLAPQTLLLLNQLLQQIKTLQQLSNQHAIAQQQCIGKPNGTVLQYTVHITKTKQQITNLQNQIAAQQAIYVKQQQVGNLGGAPSDFLNKGLHDSINAMQTNFADLGIKDPQMGQPQSRLNQWINKDKEDGGEFSRAPGSSSKSLATSPNMNPLGLTQHDGPWSSGRTGDGWPESAGGDVSNDVKDAQWPTTAQPSLTDLVPEFEPGKPWKGTQIKSIEDDPSITPGSVARSPLSIATIKDNELFNMNPNKSPPTGDVGPMSLSSSTWSFNPPSTTSSAFTSPQSKLPASAKGVLDNPAVSSELWAAPKSRGPPPGLSSKGGAGSLANGWGNTLGSAAWSSGGGNATGGGGGQQRGGSNWGGTSQWLLLRNLTAQIDGSTLRTLCMQHGPLQSFHLYLHQGFALAKYSTREEATKAQTALNNCVLGNTTILAENPTDWDASTLLQQVASQQGGSSGAWRGGGGGGGSSAKQPGSGGGGDTWTSSWGNNQLSANLWGSSGLDDPARATPSSLNSFLPGDLLGGEST